MPRAKTPQVFKGEPRTKLHYDRKEQPYFDVYIHHLTPFRAKVADAVTELVTFGGLGWAVWKLAHVPDVSLLVWATVIIAPLLFRPVLRKVIREEFFRKTTHVRLSPDRFTIFGALRRRKFDRNLPHSFAVTEHDKTGRERDKLDLEVRRAARRGRLISPPKYYGESYHLVFEHFGARHDIAAIFGKKDALAAQARLTACDDRIDTLSRKGGGTPFDPEDEWTPAPGDLPRA
jgi:hypothetical protein